jgi:putative acyl-CoA dehydrogenase
VLSYLWNQVEHGTGCPTGMAYAAHAGFAAHAPLRIWADKMVRTEYDFGRAEVAQKKSVVVGYAMTEKQGGSDLRETQTVAHYSHSDDYHGARADWYVLTGHKWFCSVPVADGFFTLAKVDGGVTCFFLPRTLPDGRHNAFYIQRLKDKCGNRSNASSEIEFAGTLALRVGDEGRGIREILSHAHLTRLDFAVGSAGLMRQALSLAIAHTSTRHGFGRPLSAQPMLANVLADMAIEVEASTLLALRVAKATDAMHPDGRGHGKPAAAVQADERAFARIATPVAKYFNCSRAPAIAFEALQCHGGNGFVEENPIARLYREAPLNSVWEGTANMMCMDVRRAILNDAATLAAVMTDLAQVKGSDARFDRFVAHAQRTVDQACADEFGARAATECLARAIQGAELIRHASQDVAEAFIATRLGGAATTSACLFGAMPIALTKAVADRIVDRARVA